MRLTLVISSLSAGGAERVLATLANEWASSGKHEVTLLTFQSAAQDFYPTVKEVNRSFLGEGGRSLPAWKRATLAATRAFTLRKAIVKTKPDLILSFMLEPNILTLLATRFLRCPVVIAERTVPHAHRMLWWVRLAQSLTYRWANTVVVQTQLVKEQLKTSVPLEKLVVIANPVASPKDFVLPPITFPKRPGEVWVLGVGRFRPEKGFDRLIEAFAKIAPRYPHARLILVGDGAEKEKLEALVDSLSIKPQTTFGGETKNVFPFLAQSDVFVLPSHYEGFPNALLEAMASGKPVVAFDCPGAAREILNDGQDGILVPNDDIAALAAGIEELILNPKARADYGVRAEKVTERYALAKILELWEAAFSHAQQG